MRPRGARTQLMNGGERVRSVFVIQEERKRRYVNLGRVHRQYCNGEVGEPQYKAEMEQATMVFAKLSRELLSLIPWFQDSGQAEAASIVQKLQLREKEKLQLTVQYQVICLKKAERERQGKELDDEDFTPAELEETVLRRRLAETEGAITELLSDLRYECESLLLSDT